MRASRVGVHTHYNPDPKRAFKDCARCGHRWQYNVGRVPPDLCGDCRLVEPQWGTAPFDDLPVSDSNVCAFDEPFVSRDNLRRRARRAARREEQA